VNSLGPLPACTGLSLAFTTAPPRWCMAPLCLTSPSFRGDPVPSLIPALQAGGPWGEVLVEGVEQVSACRGIVPEGPAGNRGYLELRRADGKGRWGSATGVGSQCRGNGVAGVVGLEGRKAIQFETSPPEVRPRCAQSRTASSAGPASRGQPASDLAALVNVCGWVELVHPPSEPE